MSKETPEPKCHCGGFLMLRLEKDAKYPYRCAKCGTEYQTPPPSSASNAEIWDLIRKILGVRNE